MKYFIWIKFLHTNWTPRLFQHWRHVLFSTSLHSPLFSLYPSPDNINRFSRRLYQRQARIKGDAAFFPRWLQKSNLALVFKSDTAQRTCLANFRNSACCYGIIWSVAGLPGAGIIELFHTVPSPSSKVINIQRNSSIVTANTDFLANFQSSTCDLWQYT